jgi:hypothetical protein
MKCPSSDDYLRFIQNPQVCFADPDLKAGHVLLDGPKPIPKVITGKSACVFQIANGNRRWAVRCFRHNITDQQERYALIDSYLDKAQLPAMAECDYVSRGICVKGQWYPVLKMEWVNGRRFDEYVRQHLFTSKGRAELSELAERWRALITSLRGLKIAHGDFHHDNILIAPGGQIRLVDYDGMFVPGLERSPAHEFGHPNYQHPGRRQAERLNEELDNFAATLVYLSLRALAAEPKLWTEHHQKDALLLAEPDFKAPAQSAAFKRLQQSPDKGVRDIAARLAAACAGPFDKIPTFERLLEGIDAAVQPAAQDIRPRYVVALTGTANYRSVGEAAAEAEPGAEIVVRSGRYVGEVLVEKSLLIVGEGAPTEVTLESEKGSALTLKRGQLTVRGLSLSDREGSSAVKVEGGELTLEDCHVRSGSKAGVFIDGAGVTAKLLRCRVTDCASSGVLIDHWGWVEVEDSHLAENRRSGIEVMNGAAARVTRCAVVGNKFEAVWVYDNCTATVEDCDLSGNGRGPWDIRGGAKVTRRNNFPDEDVLYSIFREVGLPNNVYMRPGIPGKKLTGAKSSCAVPGWEKVLLLLDYSALGWCREAMVFGLDGLYCKDSGESDTLAVRYHELPRVTYSTRGEYSLRIKNHYDVNTAYGSIPAEKIKQYLSGIESEYKRRSRRA